MQFGNLDIAEPARDPPRCAEKLDHVSFIQVMRLQRMIPLSRSRLFGPRVAVAALQKPLECATRGADLLPRAGFEGF